MEEIWKNIQGYEGKYQVSNFGRVKSLKDNNGGYREKILKQGKDKDGYLKVNLCKGRKKKTIKIHRLVAEAFIPNPNNYPIINHKDEDKTNNCIDNLEWCNQKYNMNYGTCQQRRVSNTDYKKKVENTNYKAIASKIDYKKKVANTDYKAIAEKLSKLVLQFTKEGEFVREWSSTRECERNGYDNSAVSKCCLGKLKSHKGFIWKYKE